jgi:Ni,Fe-hydrogenase I cytochrome b subunit
LLFSEEQSSKENTSITLDFIILVTIIEIVILFVFIYYTYKIYKNTNKEYECTQTCIRYMLYIQAIIKFFGIIYSIYLIYNNN